eukprot:2801698-Pleurochrysis_carterae.AAC.1
MRVAVGTCLENFEQTLPMPPCVCVLNCDVLSWRVRFAKCTQNEIDKCALSRPAALRGVREIAWMPSEPSTIRCSSV